MRIEFECSGGYGGLFAAAPLSYRVDLADLAQDQRDRLRRLIDESGLLDLPESGGRPQTSPARDTFQYRLTIRGEAVDKRFDFDDMSAPATARPLLAYLRELALEARGR